MRNFSSSCDACPDTCTPAFPPWITSAPARCSESITRETFDSLPGIACAEITTTSSLAHLDVLVLVRGHQRQRTQRLALRSGAHDAHLTGRVAWHLFDVDDPLDRDVEQTHLAGEGDVLCHRPAEERDAAAGVDRRFAHLLHAVEM